MYTYHSNIYNIKYKNQKSSTKPGEGFSKWDYVGLAKHFYEKYQFNNQIEQEKEFFKVVQKSNFIYK